jgi:hypothetical protein
MSRALRRSQILPAPPSLNPKTKIAVARSGYWDSNAEARGAERQPVRYQSCTESGGHGTMDPDDKNRNGRHIERSAAEGTESAPICTTTSPS